MRYERESVALRDNGEFLKIRSGSQVFYGGDQAWFGSTTGQHGGCGTVAAADITAYLALHYPDLSSLYPRKRHRREPDGFSGIRKCELHQEEFRHHMEVLYHFVKPWKLPFGRTLGVWPMVRLIRGVEAYSRARGVYLKGRRISSRRPVDELASFIAESLRRDCPVAMLTGRQPQYAGELVMRPDGTSWHQKSFAFHWTVITEMKRQNGRVMVRVSTWGGWSWLNLETWQKSRGLISGLVTFVWGKLQLPIKWMLRKIHFFALNCKNLMTEQPNVGIIADVAAKQRAVTSDK